MAVPRAGGAGCVHSIRSLAFRFSNGLPLDSSRDHKEAGCVLAQQETELGRQHLETAGSATSPPNAILARTAETPPFRSARLPHIHTVPKQLEYTEPDWGIQMEIPGR